MSRTHYIIHQVVRGLRGLLGLLTEQCDRCNSEQERRRVVETSRDVNLQIPAPRDAELLKNVYGQTDGRYTSSRIGDAVPGWTSYRVLRDMSPSRGLNNEFFQYSTFSGGTYSLRFQKQEHFPLPEAAKELFEKTNV